MAELSQAERCAAELLTRFPVSRPPVAVEEIARHLGVELHFHPLEPNVSGVLVRRGQQSAIGINASHHPHRQRFTIAHELGHYLMHPDTPTVFVDDAFVHFRGDDLTAEDDAQELEANAFAGALLMPEALLRQDLRDGPIDAFDEVAVRALAKRYRVSPQALTIRLIHLGLADGVAVRAALSTGR